MRNNRNRDRNIPDTNKYRGKTIKMNGYAF